MIRRFFLCVGIHILAVSLFASAGDRALPLASNWNTGATGAGFTPEWQMEMIEKGHQLLLTLSFAGPDGKYTDRHKQRCDAVLRKAAAKRIPTSFVCGEWEAPLYREKRYLALPPAESPVVVGRDGKILDFTVSYPPGKNPGISPFGPVKWWKELGRRWSDSELVRALEALYPGPPYVLILSNNEARKLPWQRAEDSKRYVDAHGLGRSDEHKRKVVGDGYIERYRALLSGMREGFGKWRGKVVLGAYGCSPLKRMGRAENWHEWRLSVPGRPSIHCYIWDAVSPSQYLTTWNANNDFSVYSPQTAAMNLVVQKELYRAVNPDLFWEVSVWDAAYRGGRPLLKPEKWRLECQSVPWERYGGLVKWLMWIPRARVVRDFRWWHEPREQRGNFPGASNSYGQVIAAVDQLRQYPLLAKFWRGGTLVPNTAHEHPYRHNIPEELEAKNRWFLLDCDANPPWPWDVDSPVHVWALAYVIGKAPRREWLVYTFAPQGARTGVAVAIPDYGTVKVDAPQSGSYYHVAEADKSVKAIAVGGPASVAITVASQFVDVGQPVAFSIADPYCPKGELKSFEWAFGDGTRKQGRAVEHAFPRKGQYVVALKASGEGGEEATRLLPIFAGVRPEEGLVVRYLMDHSPIGALHDASGRNSVGGLRGGAWVEDAERGGIVLELDGKDDYAHVYGSPDINTGEAYRNRSLLLWFRARDVTKRQALYEEGGYGAGMNVYLDGGKLYAGAWNRELWDGTWLTYEGVKAEAWYHVALVLRDAAGTPKPGRLELYVNGRKCGTGPAAQLSAHRGNVSVGSSGGTCYHDGKADKPGAYFAGRLDVLSIYNRALSPEEIQRHAKE